jgi:hypothetical protein
MYVFPEFPYPEDISPKDEYPTGKEVGTNPSSSSVAWDEAGACVLSRACSVFLVGQVHKYIKAYTAHFGLDQHIKLRCKVMQVRPCEQNRWQVRLGEG